MRNMGSSLRVSSLLFLLLLFRIHLISASDAAAAENGKCKGMVSCLKCDSTNITKCVKCSQLVVFRSKECSDSPCPPGYTKHWVSFVDYMTSVCKGGISLGGLTVETVGVIVGIVVCLLVAVCTAVYCKLQRRRKPPPSLTYSSQGSDESDCMEFVKQISELRGDAPTFLAMLNDTRRQVRGLRSCAALQPYKPVLKDLSRILILLNRTDDRLGHPPADWETLMAWGNRVLTRYKKSHPNQVNEFVSFLNSGSESGASRIDRRQFGISVFDTNYNTRKNSTDLSEWQFSELDNFYTLGFRPQDEITTEL